MKNIILLFLILGICFQTRAQQHFSKAVDFNEQYDLGEAIVKVNDGVIVMIGARCQPINRDCIGLMKVSFDGDILWQKEYDYFDSESAQRIQLWKDKLYFFGYWNAPNENSDFIMLETYCNFLRVTAFGWDIFRISKFCRTYLFGIYKSSD